MQILLMVHADMMWQRNGSVVIFWVSIPWGFGVRSVAAPGLVIHWHTVGRAHCQSDLLFAVKMHGSGKGPAVLRRKGGCVGLRQPHFFYGDGIHLRHDVC